MLGSKRHLLVLWAPALAVASSARNVYAKALPWEAPHRAVPWCPFLSFPSSLCGDQMVTRRTHGIRQFCLICFNFVLLATLRGKSNGQFVDYVSRQ